MAKNNLPFINPNAAPSQPPTKWGGTWDIVCDVWSLIAVFVGLIFTCALVYYVGSFHRWGIQPTFVVNDGLGLPAHTVQTTFADCIYFSIVTITTLGYGDFRPDSYGRIVVALEVISGIVLAGLFVSRLVSRKQERLTKRLLAGQLNDEIQGFRDLLTALKEEHKEPLMLTLEQSSAFLHDAGALSQSIARYCRHEAKEPALAEVLPSRAAGRLLGDLIALLETVHSCAANKSKSKTHPDDRKNVRNISESVLTVSTVFSERFTDIGFQHLHARIVNIVGGLRTQLALHEPW
jgi:hypothetical protein